MSQNRSETRRARQLAAKDGVPYVLALRRVREAVRAQPPPSRADDASPEQQEQT